MLPLTNSGTPISIKQANEHIEMYNTINKKAGTVIKIALRLIPDGLDAQKFFESIHINNAFVFEASLIRRFFDDPNAEKADCIVVCLGGNIDAGDEGNATVIVTGCKVDSDGKYNIVKNLSNPVSEHPAKKAIPHFDETKSESDKLYFTIK